MPGISTSDRTRSAGSSPQPGRAVGAVDGGGHVVAGGFEDRPLELADADRVLDDEHPRPALRPARRRRRSAHHRGVRRGRDRLAVVAELAQVDEADDAAVAVDGRAADHRQPAEERAEVLDDELALAVERVDRPGDLPVAVTDDDGGGRLRGRR